MCREASFVITENRVYWSRKSDSHEDIIQEFGLNHLDCDPPGFVRVELTPPGNDFRLPVSDWVFRVDQDIVPDWWNAAWAENQIRETAIDWLGCKVLLPGQVIKELKDKIFAVYGTVQEVYGGTVQKVYGGGTVQKVWDGGTVQKVWDGGTVQKVYGGGTVQGVWDGGTVQEVYGGTVIAYTHLDPIILKSPNAVLIDRSGNVVRCYTGIQNES